MFPIQQVSGHFTNDCFSPDSTRLVGNLRALSSTTLYLRGKIWHDRLSPPRVGYRKSDWLLLKHVEKQKPIKNRRPVVVLVVRGSPEGPLVLPALWSFRITSAALYRGLCVVSTDCKHPTLTRSSTKTTTGRQSGR